MMTLPSLSEAQIRQHAHAESFERGTKYYQQGAVGPLVLRGDLLQTEVVGSEYEPYLVTIRLDAGGVHTAECTCPYDWGGWCKHIVATLLAYRAAPGDVEQRSPLAALLAGLDRGQLEALLLELASQSPGLAELIEERVPAPRGTSAAASGVAAAPAPTAAPVASTPPAAGAKSRPTVDEAAFRRQILRIFRNQSTDDYLAYTGILRELAPLVVEIRAFLDGDDAQSALPLLAELTDAYSASWFEYDDSDGAMGEFFGELGALWAETLLAAQLKKGELKLWQKRLKSWSTSAEAYGCEGLNVALQAAEEGCSNPWVDAAILGEAKPGTQPTGEYAEELLAIRLRILERSGHIREALNLAAAAGQPFEHALLLACLGRNAEAIDMGLRHLRTADQAFGLAKALRERGDLAGALAVGERGLDLDGSASNFYIEDHARESLANWLFDLAAGQGQTQLALRAGAVALRNMPSLGLYQRMAELAGAGWPSLREHLLAALRTRKGWPVTGRVEIFLHEELIDDAIATLGSHADYLDVERVMEAALATHPEWVIKVAIASAEAIINPGNAQYYETAIGWLRRARAAYQVAGRSDDWTGYLEGLRTKHVRKHKLMGLLKELERPGR